MSAAAEKRTVVSIVLVFLVLIYTVPARSFNVPEKLEYELSWLGVKAGDSVLEVSEDEEKRRRIVSTTRSVPWISVFYPVEDRVESVFIPKTVWIPVTYRLDQHEGDRRKDIEIRFDAGENKALYIDHIAKKEQQYDIPDVVYDPLSALYRVRDIDLVVGKSAFITLFDSKKTYDLEVKVIRKETIEVPAGKFDTVLVVPILESEGIFSREGPIYTWLTDDERRIPVKLKTRVAVGSVAAELVGSSYWRKQNDTAGKDQASKR